jgi:hypothetical protein
MAGAGQIHIEPVILRGGERGRDFVLYEDSGKEIFSARLMDDSKELKIAWTDNLA